MLTFAYYLLKIIICSGILYGYYLLALRNKIFHRWNRFYLLAAVILSLSVPLIKINIRYNTDGPKTRVIQLLRVVNSSDEIVFKYQKGKGNFRMDSLVLSLFLYFVVSVLLSAFLIHTLFKISMLKKNNRQTILEGINLINTNAKGTPFSFFNNIFWNDKIDINTATGKQIFQHELAHVQEKHSYDKVFMNIALIFFWCNPFFWLIRKELNMIHEFIADQKALEGSDTAAFAAMILQAAYPQQQFIITNNFFYSPLKRRLLMLTKNKNSKIGYAGRLLVLPLAALVFFAFTLRMKTISSVNHYTGKKITVVIDAGHGGEDNGAESENGIYEKNLTLSIAKKIKELNDNKNLNIVLSRNKDENITVRERVDLAKSLHADLFISIHLDAALTKNINSGLDILIPANDNGYLKESAALGTAINESFKRNYMLPVAKNLKQINEAAWVLKGNKYPAVLIEAGFLTNDKDMEFLTRPESQQLIARNILNGIEKYTQETLLSISNNVPGTNDTISGRGKGAAYIDTKNRIFLNADTIIFIYDQNKTREDVMKAVLLINGKIENNDILKSKLIVAKRIIIHSGDETKMVSSYGEAAKNGVFVFEDAVIINKPPYYPDEVGAADKKVDKVFTQADVDPSFPGGEQAWKRYITITIQKNIDTLMKENQRGTCRIKFIVGTDGSISDATALTMQGTKLAKVAVDAIRKGPKWVPAKQNGHLVAAYKEIPISFVFQDQDVTSYKKQPVTFVAADNTVDNKEPK